MKKHNNNNNNNNNNKFNKNYKNSNNKKNGNNNRNNKYNRNNDNRYNKYNKSITKIKISDLPLETNVKDLVDLFKLINVKVGSINIKQYENKVAYVEFFDKDEALYCVNCLDHTAIDPYNIMMSVRILDY